MTDYQWALVQQKAKNQNMLDQLNQSKLPPHLRDFPND